MKNKKKTVFPFLEEEVEDSLDVRGGKIISAYVLVEVVKKLETLKEGDALCVVTDAFAGLQRDMEAWSRLTGHELRNVTPTDSDFHAYVIVKRAVKEAKKKKVAIVISRDKLDELISPLGFALSAAASGMEVALYFQGPGVHVLHRNFKGTMTGLWAPFSRLIRGAMAAQGHVPPTEKIQQLHDLGAKLYACHPSLKAFGVPLKDTLFPEDVIPSEYVTFLELMQDATIQLYP
jgi:predicted peroxiredoxin/TusA-related sulfurtransferase